MGRFDFLYKMDLQHRAVAVYIYLADRANRDGECWPAIPTIARELKLSQSTVRRALQDLRKADLLEQNSAIGLKAARAACFFASRICERKAPAAKGPLRPLGGRWLLSWWRV